MPPNAKPSTPSPKPEPAAAPSKGLNWKGKPRQRAPGAGRKKGDGAFVPTAEQRQLVMVMAGMGISELDQCQAIVNPETKAPITAKTLRKHFRDELDRGMVQANTKVVAGLFKNATQPVGENHPHGLPVAQIFWLKCRLRWQQSPHLAPPPAPPAAIERDPVETARRLAFLLAQGAAAREQQEAPKVIPGRKKKLKTPA